jgi:hypothetical protein
MLRLEFSIGGYFGDSFAIKLDGATVEYSHYPERSDVASTATLEASAAQLSAFVATLDELGVDGWEPQYSSMAVDGTSWHLVIDRGGRVLGWSGSNGYPDDKDASCTSPYVSARFQAFLDALSALAGGRPIY